MRCAFFVVVIIFVSFAKSSDIFSINVNDFDFEDNDIEVDDNELDVKPLSPVILGKRI